MPWRSEPAMQWIADHLIEIKDQTARLDQRTANAELMLYDTRRHLQRQDRDLAVIKTRLRQSPRPSAAAEIVEIIKTLWPLLVIIAALTARLLGASPELISSWAGLATQGL